MRVFPRRQTDILALAGSIANGLTNSAAHFPSPPVAVAELEAAIAAATQASETATAAQAAAEQATAAKQAAFERLKAMMWADLRYAEDAVAYDDAKLTALGWGARKRRRPPAIPGQPLGLAAPHQAEGSVVLTWRSAADGGRVGFYRIERRQGEGPWAIAAVSIPTRATLEGQPRLVDLEYRVIAANKTGESEPSNTVAVVL